MALDAESRFNINGVKLLVLLFSVHLKYKINNRLCFCAVVFCHAIYNTCTDIKLSTQKFSNSARRYLRVRGKKHAKSVTSFSFALYLFSHFHTFPVLSLPYSSL